MAIGSNRSFQSRLTLSMLLLLLFTIASLVIVNYQIERQILVDQITKRGLLMGKAVQLDVDQHVLKSAPSDLAGIPDDEREQIRDFIRHFGEEEAQFDIYSQAEGVHDLFFIDPASRVIIDYPANKEQRILPPNERLQPGDLMRLRHNDILSNVGVRGKDTILFLTFPVFSENQLIGLGRIEMSMNAGMTLLSRIKFWSIVAAVALLLIGVAFAAYLSRTVTRPIGDLVQAAARIGAGDLTVRLSETSQDEIGVLKIAFNRMIDGIVKLEETQKRMERSEVASQLAARMAHEIKNPLNSIGLIVDHISDRFEPEQEPGSTKFRELAVNIKSELSRLNGIVEGFLRFARPITPYKKAVAVSALIEDTLNFIQPEAQKQNVTIHSHLNEPAITAMADYSQLRQALLNLLINALQAMPEGGRIDVNTTFASGDRIRIEVRDTGPGIAPENLPKLFDPYFTTKVHGFGLGLAIVDRIVQDHGGSVGVVSEIGKGTTFTITLPASRVTARMETCTT